MSKWSNIRRMTKGARVLQLLRIQAKLSTRGAAAASGVKDGVINHLEHGRIKIGERHLEKLLPAYKVERATYDLLASGQLDLPPEYRYECLSIIRAMTDAQIRDAYPVLVSLSGRKV